ncbi:hypothetical protein PoB_000736000 [Plakobranchus ocellatus]|uniref:Uncharacterized protein n=1 Tax=Plakobranchus ocellatus TaxID=259542 RepID=A0AAV3YCU1_9GAST|nr:hypothetical protein PoB_000736000 [Plakobranchus ocellatus]
MPRSHVSVARFYDWTDDLGDCFSVSRLYREIANIPRLDSKGALRCSQPTLANTGAGNINNGTSMINIASATGAVVHHGTKGRAQHQFYISPGRMFVRDKKALTRGEREIIEGIYKNRGDVGCSSRDAMSRSEFQVKSHQEAWIAGKGGIHLGMSVTDESGAIGRAIMKGIRLDTPTKGGSPQYSSAESQGHARLQTVAFSADDLSSSINYEVNFRDRRSPRERKHTSESSSSLDAQKQFTVSTLEPAVHLKSQERVKRTVLTQNHIDYWDSRPSAPPSSPNRLDDSPPTTPNLRSPLTPPFPIVLHPSSISMTNFGSPATDKLLGLRPSLPTNSILLAEKIQSCSSSDKNSKQRTLNSHSPQNVSEVSFTSDEKVTNIIKIDEKDFNSNEHLFDKHHSRNKSTFSSPDFDDATTQLSSFDTFDDTLSTINNEMDKKKVKVRVYLPTVGAETHDDDVITKTPLVKERPLSHSSFKAKNSRQEMPLS